MTATAAPTRPLRLRLSCPDFAAREAVPTEMGIQDRHRVLHAGTCQEDGTITYDITVSVVRHPADGSVRYRGPFVHGTPAEPYLYISLRPVGAQPAAWRRRLKVRFPTLTWDEVASLPESAVLATYISGERSRTVPLHTYEWTRLAGDEP
jgi:hypothetical protein